MIRINLLPVRQVRKAKEGQVQLAILGGALFVVLVVLTFVYEARSTLNEEKKRQSTELSTQIEQLKKDVGDFEQLKQQRDKLIAQRDVIKQLNTARTGPVQMMLELSYILSPGKGPTVDQTQYEIVLRRDPNAGFNPRWNPRRLWIERIEEKAEALSIQGKAKDHDDVAEFLKRLALSKHFTEVFLQRNDQVTDSELGIKVVRFSLSCKVKYG